MHYSLFYIEVYSGTFKNIPLLIFDRTYYRTRKRFNLIKTEKNAIMGWWGIMGNALRKFKAKVIGLNMTHFI